MKKYPLLYFTNIILNKEWKSRYFEITSRKKFIFNQNKTSTKNSFIVKGPHLCSLL